MGAITTTAKPHRNVGHRGKRGVSRTQMLPVDDPSDRKRGPLLRVGSVVLSGANVFRGGTPLLRVLAILS